MGRWFLVRHGQTDWNAAGRAQGQSQVPLNAAGRAQARALATRLRPLCFSAADASDLRRVTETAAPILHGRDLPQVTVAAVGPILARYDTVVLDCLTLWVSNLLLRHPDAPGAEAAILDAVETLVEMISRSTATWIVISNEVGLGVVPPSPLGRTYRDALGLVNQLVAAHANRVYLMVAGLALELKELNARPFSQAP